jgi:hypothetical protein
LVVDVGVAEANASTDVPPRVRHGLGKRVEVNVVRRDGLKIGDGIANDNVPHFDRGGSLGSRTLG